MKVVKDAAAQMSPMLYRREGIVGEIAREIHEPGRGAQFATVPETVVPYYHGTEHLRLLDQAMTVPSPATDVISEATRRAGR